MNVVLETLQAEDKIRQNQYAYQANSNLVLQAEREGGPRSNEPTGEVCCSHTALYFTFGCKFSCAAFHSRGVGTALSVVAGVANKLGSLLNPPGLLGAVCASCAGSGSCCVRGPCHSSA